MIVAANPNIISYSLGDPGPAMQLTLMDPDLNNPGDLVPLVLVPDADTVVLNYTDPSGAPHTVTLPIVNASAGGVERVWVVGDLPAIGAYVGQVVVQRAGDSTFPRTYPRDKGRISWHVFQPVAAVAVPTTNYINDDASSNAIGVPVYETTAGHAATATTEDVTHATVIGLRTAACAPGASGPVQSNGPMILATSLWDALTGQTGGLTPFRAYYVGTTTELTLTPPSTIPGQQIAFVGIAASAQQLDVNPIAPITAGNITIKKQLHIAMGQSNCVGPGNASQAPSGLQTYDQSIPFFQQTAPAGTLAAWNTNYFGMLGPYAPSSPNIGLEATFARALQGAGVGVIMAKFGQSETNLANDWNGTLTALAVAWLENMIEFTGTTVGSLSWTQGESDAVDDGFSAAYHVNLFALMAMLRAIIGPAAPIAITRLNSGITILPSGNITLIRAAQEAYVASDPNSVIVNTDDLQSVWGGSVDYSTGDILTIGSRVAAAILPMITGYIPSPITRDTSSYEYWPATLGEWTSLLAWLPGSPSTPDSNYNLTALVGTDSIGSQAISIGGGWTSVAPLNWTKNALTSADGNTQPCSSTAGPFGDPYTAPHLVILRLAITGAPSGTHDILGIGGSTAYRGVSVNTSLELVLRDLGSGAQPAGVFAYDTSQHLIAFQVDPTGDVTQIITDREVITQSPFNALATTSLLFTLGNATGAGGAPVAIEQLATWRGTKARMSIATIRAIFVRLRAGIGALS